MNNKPRKDIREQIARQYIVGEEREGYKAYENLFDQENRTILTFSDPRLQI